MPESGSACGRQLLLEVIGLSLQAVVLTPQAFVAALQAFVLVSQARAGRPRRPRPLSAPPFLLRAWLPFLTAIPSALVGHTRVMPYCEKLYKYKIVVFLIAQQRDLAKRIRSKNGCPAFVGRSAVSTHIGDACRAAGLLPIAMALKCTKLDRSGRARIADFCYRLLTHLQGVAAT